MQIDIDPASEVPIYQQLRDRVVERVATGDLRPGDPLASVRQLAVAFGINVATVAKGYDLLRSEGLIRTNRKSGSVVARGPGMPPTTSESFVDDWGARLRTLLAEASAQGVPDADIQQCVAMVLEEFAKRRSEQPSSKGPER